MIKGISQVKVLSCKNPLCCKLFRSVLNNGEFPQYCSKKCRPNNLKLYGRTRERLVVLEYYDYTCVKCGKKYESKKLHAHHIRPRSKGGDDDLNNQIPLCISCHRKTHNNSHLEPDNLINYPDKYPIV